MITLKNYTLSENGRRIDYHYSATGPAVRFLNPAESFFVRYDHDISSCPPGIAVIPFIANFITLAWFGKFDLVVPEVEATFAGSLVQLRAEFQRMYPRYPLTGVLVAPRSAPISWPATKSLMLFSGGMDAYTTLIRHHSENLDLVTILGADIEITDTTQWHRCLNHIKTEPFSGRLPHLAITANMRTFYNDNVEASLVFGWWGKVQHGPGLLGLLAPLSFIRRASLAYIASSYNVPMVWGSTQSADEKIKWGGLSVVHDAAELSRQAKAEVIAAFCQQRQESIQLRVCYSEVARDGNCGRCEKCYRTMMNLILAGVDPRSFGFPFTAETYPQLFTRLSTIRASAGLRVFWEEISRAASLALKNKNFFVLTDRDSEVNFLKRLADGEINRALERNHRPWRDHLARWKFIIRVRFPRFYNAGRGLVRLLRRLK